VALDEVAAEGFSGAQRGLEVDLRPRLEPAEVGARDRLRDGVELERAVFGAGDRQAASGDGDRVAEVGPGGDLHGLDSEADAPAVSNGRDDVTSLANDPREHAESLARPSPPNVTLSSRSVTDTCEFPDYDRLGEEVGRTVLRPAAALRPGEPCEGRKARRQGSCT